MLGAQSACGSFVFFHSLFREFALAPAVVKQRSSFSHYGLVTLKGFVGCLKSDVSKHFRFLSGVFLALGWIETWGSCCVILGFSYVFKRCGFENDLSF
jgi:hypothetical protein